jgi:hypothetical protein
MSEKRPPDTDFDEREAAQRIGYQPITLRTWRMQGRGPAYIRAGRSIRYTLPDLDAWRSAHRVETRDSRPPQEPRRNGEPQRANAGALPTRGEDFDDRRRG